MESHDREKRLLIAQESELQESVQSLQKELGKSKKIRHVQTCSISQLNSWGPFLKRPGKLTSPKSYFEIKVSRKVGCVLTSNEVRYVSLSDNFTVQFSKLLKLSSYLENKTA